MDASALNPAEINGDLPLTRAQIDAYLHFHTRRNTENTQRSAASQIVTLPVPLRRVTVAPTSSPQRLMIGAFFAMAAQRLATHYNPRPVTMLDVGCGAGAAILPFFEAAGFRGRYIGLDIAQHKNFSATASRAFTRELIVADVHTFNPAALPPIDLLVSATALEHIHDDGGTIERFAACLAPGGAQVHCVPGEAALPIYGHHGWRQYSPFCLRTLFPAGDIYRSGGCCSVALHKRAISPGGAEAWRDRHPYFYRHLRNLSVVGDRLLGNHPCTMYGVVVPPSTPTVAAAKAAA